MSKRSLALAVLSCAVHVLLVAFMALLATPAELDLRPPGTSTIDSVPPKRGDQVCTRAKDTQTRLAPPSFAFAIPVPTAVVCISAAAPRSSILVESPSPARWLTDQRAAIRRFRPRKLPSDSDSSAC